MTTTIDSTTESICPYCDDEASIFAVSDTRDPVEEMCIAGMTHLTSEGSTHTEHIYIRLDERDDCGEIWSKPISYCPFCGRKLSD